LLILLFTNCVPDAYTPDPKSRLEISAIDRFGQQPAPEIVIERAELAVSDRILLRVPEFAVGIFGASQYGYPNGADLFRRHTD
jgi:hypothetical protein